MWISTARRGGVITFEQNVKVAPLYDGVPCVSASLFPTVRAANIMIFRRSASTTAKRFAIVPLVKSIRTPTARVQMRNAHARTTFYVGYCVNDVARYLTVGLVRKEQRVISSLARGDCARYRHALLSFVYSNTMYICFSKNPTVKKRSF